MVAFGDGLVGFGARAGQGHFGRRFLNPGEPGRGEAARVRRDFPRDEAELGVSGDDQHRFVAAGQTVDLKANQRALDNGEFANGR